MWTFWQRATIACIVAIFVALCGIIFVYYMYSNVVIEALFGALVGFTVVMLVVSVYGMDREQSRAIKALPSFICQRRLRRADSVKRLHGRRRFGETR